MQITEQQHKAAGEIIDLIAEELGEKRAIHPGTAITSCGRLAGSFLFRSFNLPTNNISPGTVVLSENANEKGPVLINILGWMLDNLNINIDSDKLKEFSHTESNLNFLDTLDLLQSRSISIMNQNNLSFEEMAYSCAMATAFIVKECQNDLKVEVGFNTAIYSFIEGSKTYPPEIQNTIPKKKNIFKFWK